MKWIDIRKEQPQNNDIVIVCDVFTGLVTLAKCENTEEDFSMDVMNIDSFNSENIDMEVTHWMHLPLSLPCKEYDLEYEE